MERVPLAHLPTPVEPLDRLGRELGLEPGRLLVKRDDATGLAGGGNKARKLEYLCAEALAAGCDTLVTGGGRQSNHVRMTAAAAARLGLGCTLVLGSDAPRRPSGHVLLDHLFGADIVWTGAFEYAEVEAAIEATGERLRAAGRRPAVAPIGGASPTGAFGYVAGARELLEQVPDVALVVTADGSGGTHAGLATGLGSFDRVLGVDVGARDDLETAVPEMAEAVAALAGSPAPAGECRVDRERIGAGYAEPTDECREALDLAARLEGLVLDPVYTGKAMAGLVAAARDRALPDGRIVFLHTGGMPALFAGRYADWIVEGVSRSPAR